MVCLRMCLFVYGSDSETILTGSPHPVCLPGAEAGILWPCHPCSTDGPGHKSLTATPLPRPHPYVPLEMTGLSLGKVPHFAGEQGYEKGAPFPGGRHHPLGMAQEQKGPSVVRCKVELTQPGRFSHPHVIKCLPGVGE